MRFPKLRIGNIHDPPPEIRLGQVFLPFAKVLAVEVGKFRRHPGLGVNAVGDAGDRHFVYRHTRPDILPQGTADIAVQSTNTVSMTTHPERQDGHAKWIVRIDSVLSE